MSQTTPSRRHFERSPDCLDIAVVNNMPDGALQSTERQFINLLGSAADGLAVRLTFFGLPDVPRSDSGRRHVDTFYSSIQDLWDRRFDGVIVTGNEPRSPNLAAEPYWHSLTCIMDWADENTSSSLWSCLAAHAAVLHFDGVSRHRLAAKRCGVFPCVQAVDHPLMAGVSSPLVMPHSRWNELREAELAESGYQILTRSAHAGVDSFIKNRKSLFVFFQGHPEYENNTLLLEYRRDIGRYLRGETETYPDMPQFYFDSGAAALLNALRERAQRDRHERVLAEFPAAALERTLVNAWRPVASATYRNWLTYLSVRKPLGRTTRQARKEPAPNPVVVARRVAAGAS